MLTKKPPNPLPGVPCTERQRLGTIGAKGKRNHLAQDTQSWKMRGGGVPVTRGISLLEATDLVGIVVLGGNAASTTREL